MAEKKLAPGTLEHTRQNIGPIDPAEAAKMQKVLGGEVLQERSAPVNPDSLPKSKKRNRAVVKGSGLSSSDVSAQSGSANLPKMSGASGIKVGGKMMKTDDDLQEMTAHDIKMIDRLMMSEAYDLKPDRGVFNFFYNLSAKNRRKLSKSYGEYKIKSNIDHLQAFISTIKTFIQISPDTYKAKIATETELKFKFLRSVGKWTVHDIKIMGEALQENAGELTVGMMVPFVSAVYKELLTVYYIGDQKVAGLIKDIYNDLSQYPKVDKVQVQTLAKQGITEWLYVVDQMVRGMYPLLMRMCGTGYEAYPKFFTSQAGQILKFVGLSKFDLLIAEKEKPAEKDAAEADEKKEAEKKPQVRQMGEFDELAKSGLKVLEQLFPDAGFSSLDKHPDMFPYFQPIYKFDDGFNMLSPMNGIQVLVVLLQILEDFFHGCRNIKFNLGDDETIKESSDDISTIFSEWSNYREDLFFKQYGEYLRQFVNTAYSQKDYPQTQFGKENLNNMFWRAKYYFFPSLKFSAPTLTKPQNDSKYRPLNIRVDYLKTILTTLVRRIDENQAGKKPVLGIMNPWDRYSFDVPNPVSKRLDVLLGAKRSDDVTAATNANLLKYTLCIVSVLDWWVNNPTSPAYITDTSEIYRIDKDGGPGFSAPERSDQNKLFADAVKAAAAKANI